eukprot:TRINITY_DN2080_c0_g1_i3.p1 TRINITY_DN2080_c0_g1~~TRINITY_DN2080_c0_g1_i3.p1  ORF type:complete len:167 (-),score=12.48 TRINITY_DN2080_c0_g1_i3:77-577(-)
MKAPLTVGVLLFTLSCATRLRHRIANVSADVEQDARVNFQIHDSFQDQENNDIEHEREIEASEDFAAIQAGRKTSRHNTIDPCSAVQCGVLRCPAGFSSTKFDGHCCPYCVNPNVKADKAVTGATGSFGGKMSTFCPDVWCFPTLCGKPVTAPTTSNGLCCDSCPA